MAFISEIHYKNSYANTSGVDEFVEISLTADEALRASDFTLTTYNLDGTPIDTFNLGSVTPVIDPVTGLYVYSFDTVTTDPNGGSAENAEAIALTDSTLAAPVQFFDIGGGVSDIPAVGGAADGFISTNIPAASGAASIQFDIDGNRIDGPLTVGSAVCIANGSWIDTPNGPVLIEDLRVGDTVMTLDDGPQELRWIHSRHVRRKELRNNPALAPIRISAGALGQDCPRADLRVSPQHQMLVHSAYATLMLDTPQCLVKAKDLAAHNDCIARDTTGVEVVYFHLLFDAHQIVFANGAPTESFYPGPEAIAALDVDQRHELVALFPNLCQTEQVDYIALKHWEAAAILTPSALAN